jgi:hypothetical protein
LPDATLTFLLPSFRQTFTGLDTAREIRFDRVPAR